MYCLAIYISNKKMPRLVRDHQPPRAAAAQFALMRTRRSLHVDWSGRRKLSPCFLCYTIARAGCRNCYKSGWPSAAIIFIMYIIYLHIIQVPIYNLKKKWRKKTNFFHLSQAIILFFFAADCTGTWTKSRQIFYLNDAAEHQVWYAQRVKHYWEKKSYLKLFIIPIGSLALGMRETSIQVNQSYRRCPSVKINTDVGVLLFRWDFLNPSIYPSWLCSETQLGEIITTTRIGDARTLIN